MTRPLLTLTLIAATMACGGEAENRAASEKNGAPGSRTAASATDRPPAADADLCDQITDDAALTPAGAETIEIPGVQEANSDRRCINAFGVDMPIQELRAFYRSTLAELGYEIVSYEEMDGMVHGNLSRTFLRASRPGLQVNLQIDEFDPAETTLADHEAAVKLQIDAMGD